MSEEKEFEPTKEEELEYDNADLRAELKLARKEIVLNFKKRFIKHYCEKCDQMFCLLGVGVEVDKKDPLDMEFFYLQMLNVPDYCPYCGKEMNKDKEDTEADIGMMD